MKVPQLLIALIYCWSLVAAQTGPCGANEQLCLGVGHPVKWQLLATQQIRFRQGMDPLPQEPGSYTKGMVGWRVNVSIVSGHAEICCYWPFGAGGSGIYGDFVCAKNSTVGSSDFDMSLSQTFTLSTIMCSHRSSSDKNLTYFQMTKTPIYAGPGDNPYRLSFALDTRSTKLYKQVSKNAILLADDPTARNYTYFLWNSKLDLPKFEKIWEGDLGVEAQNLILVGDTIFYAEGAANKQNTTVLRWWYWDAEENLMRAHNNTGSQIRVLGSSVPGVQAVPNTDSIFIASYVNAPKWGITAGLTCGDIEPVCILVGTPRGQILRIFDPKGPLDPLSLSMKPTQSENIFDNAIIHFSTFAQWPDYPSSNTDSYYATVLPASLKPVSQDPKPPSYPPSVKWEPLPPTDGVPGYAMYQTSSRWTPVISFYEVIGGQRINITTVPQNDSPQTEHYWAYTSKGLTWKVVYHTPNRKDSVYRIMSYSRVAPGNWQPFEDSAFPSFAPTNARWSLMEDHDVLCLDNSLWFARVK